MKHPAARIGPSLKRRPLAIGLALALAAAATAPPVLAHTHDFPRLSAALADLEGRPHAGWRPIGPVSRAETEATLAAWHAQPRRAIPAHLLDRPRGTTHVVTNCDDTGPGSLRETLANAADTDVVDLGKLACSTITLTSGAVITLQINVTITGPGANALTIRGVEGGSGVVVHLGSGTLTVQRLALSDGHKYAADAAVTGGCIRSGGSVVLVDATVSSCEAATAAASASAMGGAIHATGNVDLFGAVVADSVALNLSKVSGDARGATMGAAAGGIYAGGRVNVFDSVVVGNSAQSLGMPTVGAGVVALTGLNSKYSLFANNVAQVAGAFYATGSSSIAQSTIALNYAEFLGVGVMGAGPLEQNDITNSTITNNATESKYGMVIGGTTTISNSTIAQNACLGPDCVSAGITLVEDDALVLDSTIIADNMLLDSGVAGDIAGPATMPPIGGADNLVTASTVPLPADTLSASPKLSLMRVIEDFVIVLVPKGNSPAINAGNNNAGLTWDQRGPEFTRVSGPAADIGAYETDASDYLFADDFHDQ